jgi:hypothetical protein
MRALERPESIDLFVSWEVAVAVAPRFSVSARLSGHHLA